MLGAKDLLPPTYDAKLLYTACVGFSYFENM